MIVKFIIHAENVETFMGKKGEQKTRRLTLLDNSEGHRASQFFELNLPADHPPIGVGKPVSVAVDQIAQVFAGRGRIMGTVVK